MEPFAIEELVPGIAIQILGWFLLLSSAFMFIKHALLRHLEHALHMNILVASAGFLFTDWWLLVPGVTGCELFTFTFFIFGSAGTFSTALIALERYRKMMRLPTTPPTRKWQLLPLCSVWFSSFALIAYPAFQKLQASNINSGDSPYDLDLDSSPASAIVFHNALCLFSNSLVFTNSVISISFTSFSVLIPLIFMLFCYIRIFKHVRSVRINRWLNHVATRRGREARVIKSHGRKANVFQVGSAAIASSDRNFDTIAYSRERSVLLKGIFSVCVVIAAWIPSSTLLIYLSTNGFDDNYVKYLKYVMMIAKLSVPMNIIHYICLNVRYRKLYIQTLMGLFRLLCPTPQTEMDVTSLVDSHIAPTSQCFREAILTTAARNSGLHVLTPIIEPPRSRNPSGNLTLSGQETRQAVSPTRQMRRVLLRTKSMPLCTKRSGTVAPIS